MDKDQGHLTSTQFYVIVGYILKRLTLIQAYNWPNQNVPRSMTQHQGGTLSMDNVT